MACRFASISSGADFGVGSRCEFGLTVAAHIFRESTFRITTWNVFRCNVFVSKSKQCRHAFILLCDDVSVHSNLHATRFAVLIPGCFVCRAWRPSHWLKKERLHSNVDCVFQSTITLNFSSFVCDDEIVSGLLLGHCLWRVICDRCRETSNKQLFLPDLKSIYTFM